MVLSVCLLMLIIVCCQCVLVGQWRDSPRPTGVLDVFSHMKKFTAPFCEIYASSGGLICGAYKHAKFGPVGREMGGVPTFPCAAPNADC